jgi:hypothetical protein
MHTKFRLGNLKRRPRHKWKDNIGMGLGKLVGRCGLDSSGSG